MAADISIVIPVYNEAQNIMPLAEEVAGALARQSRDYELLFVDDGSSDKTWEMIQQAKHKHPQVRGLRHERNSGQSSALWTGMQNSRGIIIGTLDGDLQNDPADLLPMLRHLEEVDFVCGKRTKRQDSWVRKMSSRVARWARRLVLRADFADTGCAMRVFKRTAMEGLFPFNGLHRFLPILVEYNGAKTLEVPVNHRPRQAGVSKYGVGNRLWRGIFDLIGVRWYQKRKLKPVRFTDL